MRAMAEPDTSNPPRLFVIGDVGGPGHYHLGDEAMLEANLARLRQIVPGIRFTVASADPDWTSKRYGVASLPIPRIPSGHSPESWTRVIGNMPGRWADWLGPEIDESLGTAAGLLISGGGNLCATWPEKVLERVALLERARELDLPAVIVGQTIGPSLTRWQRGLLSGALQGAAWVGVRDGESATLASSLGVPAGRLRQHLDDAFFLEPLPVEDRRAGELRLRPKPWILVTLDGSFGTAAREPALSVLASQLDSLAESLNGTLIFVPHVGGADVRAGWADDVAGRALATRMRADLLILDLWQPREVRWLIGQAALVVSTRYHPLVFATAAGVPSLGIYTDPYTRVKLRGALGAADLEGWCMSSADLESCAFLPLALELWHRRKEIMDDLVRLRADGWRRELQRWGEICRAFRLEAQGIPEFLGPLRNFTTAGTSNIRKRDMNGISYEEKSAAGEKSKSILSEEQWWQYQQNGYLRLGQVLDACELAALQERMDAIMLGRVRYSTLRMQLDTGGAYEDLPEPVAGVPEVTLAYRKVQGLESDPLVLELIRRDLFREICARQYGKHASISFFRVMLMNKPAGKGTYLPWHQDAGNVWKLDRDPLVTLWVALDPATQKNGCLQVIPGSHRLGLLSKNGSTVSQDHVERYCPQEAIEYLEMEAGEALLVHNWLLHRSDVNHTGEPRRALSVCYMDGRTLNTLTGTRFPILFGENQDAESALPFLRRLREMEQVWRDADRYQRIVWKSIDAVRRCREMWNGGSRRR
jgi:polysaccharide pyruvyl transferase WcaK-like protein